MKQMVFAGALLALSITGANAAADGTWYCSANGNIPIGILKVNGSAYDFQAVSDTAWTLKPSDPSNGSGTLDPLSGPLKDKFGADSISQGDGVIWIGSVLVCRQH